jgi:hypothetical protein
MEDIVRVPIPNSTSRYAFHREELLIYALTKMKTGVTHSYMEEYVIGGMWTMHFFWC